MDDGKDVLYGWRARHCDKHRMEVNFRRVIGERWRILRDWNLKIGISIAQIVLSSRYIITGSAFRQAAKF